MRSWQSSRNNKQEPPQPAPAEDAGAGVGSRSGLYGAGQDRPKSLEYRTMRIRTVQLALVPVVVGVMLLVVVPAIVVDLTPRHDPSDGAHRDGDDPTRIDPEAWRLQQEQQQGEQRSNQGVLLSSSESLQARIEAARALARSADPERGMKALLQGAQSHDPETRRAAAMGLIRRLGDSRAEDALWKLLDDADTSVARHTATALGAVERSDGLLVARLDSPDPEGEVHLACLRALPYTGRPQVLPSLMRFVNEPGKTGDAAKATVWKICQRTRTALPPEFPDWRPRR